jgi:hypothetical protein
LKWLDQQDRVPEIESADLSKLMFEHFEIKSHRVDNKSHLFRFKADGKSLDIPTNDRTTAFAPLVVLRLLRKFDISQADFNSAYNECFKLGRPA